MDRNELPLDTHHQGVPSGLPKLISMPVLHLTQTVHRSCTEIKTMSIRIEMGLCLIHIIQEYNQGFQNDFLALVRLAQAMYLSCVDINTISKWIETSFHLTHIT
jgi:hypothetical protein